MCADVKVSVMGVSPKGEFELITDKVSCKAFDDDRGEHFGVSCSEVVVDTDEAEERLNDMVEDMKENDYLIIATYLDGDHVRDYSDEEDIREYLGEQLSNEEIKKLADNAEEYYI